ncbi:uncharacterized protein LOC126318621 [Schistocerca gregaria]|uniref:uncharacterized protein LOC126318621 n=1 Tax=Schistocerca gregaria TaxID=7010 RepID=UPI00211EB7CE|nr:uncharacterized protein LOC126318621 [Schistocerca gregaria]
MLNRIFLRFTRNNKVRRVVSEVYLRNDIFCGSSICKHCYNDSNFSLVANDQRAWSQNLTAGARKGEVPNYFIIDVDVVLNQMELLQRSEIKDVIILQTVLEGVREASHQYYQLLRDICGDGERHFYIFSNEFHEETHVERNPGETRRAFNARTMRVAAAWYRDHFKGSASIYVVTNNERDAELAREDGLQVLTMYEYLSKLENDELMDMLAIVEEREMSWMRNPSKKELELEPIYPEHLSESEILKALSDKSRSIYQGVIRQSLDNCLEATVMIGDDDTRLPPEEREILIKGKVAMNRSVDGDVVLVELLSKDCWQAPSPYFIDVDTPEDQLLLLEEVEEMKKEKLLGFVRVKENAKKQPTGKVVAIVKKCRRSYAGAIERRSKSVEGDEGNADVECLFVPLDRRVSKIRIRTRRYAKLLDKRIVVSIDGWSRYSLLPWGHYVRTLGPVGDKKVEAEALLLQHQIELAPFPSKVLAELPPINSPVLADGSRLDLRGELIFSIDPPGCTDIDDALHVKQLENGNFQVGVHIADVSHYVKEGSQLDEEARKRGNTVYLVDRRIDMLPRELGECLCSINCGVDRYAFSVLWELTPPSTENKSTSDADNDTDMQIVGHSFHKTVVRSRANLSYGEAQTRMDDLNKNDELTQSLRLLNRMAKVLRSRRIKAGALVLASPEVNFIKDQETQDPIDVEMYQAKETNYLIEEFMLLANVTVAVQICRSFPAFALLRHHPPPNQSKLHALSVSLEHYGIRVDSSDGKHLAETLEMGSQKFKNGSSANNLFDRLLRIMVTRTMNRARYFPSGSLAPSQFYHYGLAEPIYTHFTSPIRRFADIIVHRLLAASINHCSLSKRLGVRYIHRVCDSINRRYRMAERASRDSIRYHTLQYFRGKVMTNELAHVLSLAANGFDVLVHRYGIEGKVYLGSDGSNTRASDWVYNPKKQTLSTNDEKIVIVAFKRVKVEFCIQAQQSDTPKLVFRCVEPAIHASFKIKSKREPTKESYGELTPPKKKAQNTPPQETTKAHKKRKNIIPVDLLQNSSTVQGSRKK